MYSIRLNNIQHILPIQMYVWWKMKAKIFFIIVLFMQLLGKRWIIFFFFSFNYEKISRRFHFCITSFMNFKTQTYPHTHFLFEILWWGGDKYVSVMQIDTPFWFLIWFKTGRCVKCYTSSILSKLQLSHNLNKKKRYSFENGGKFPKRF